MAVVVVMGTGYWASKGPVASVRALKGPSS